MVLNVHSNSQSERERERERESERERAKERARGERERKPTAATTDRRAQTTAFVTLVVEYWLEQEINRGVYHKGSI